MLFNHASATVSYSFDEPNLVSVAGLVPVMSLAQEKITVATTGADKAPTSGRRSAP